MERREEEGGERRDYRLYRHGGKLTVKAYMLSIISRNAVQHPKAAQLYHLLTCAWYRVSLEYNLHGVLDQIIADKICK